MTVHTHEYLNMYNSITVNTLGFEGTCERFTLKLGDLRKDLMITATLPNRASPYYSRERDYRITICKRQIVRDYLFRKYEDRWREYEFS